jgi:hypothetical protein
MSSPDFVSFGTLYREKVSRQTLAKDLEISGSSLFSAGGTSIWQRNVSIISEYHSAIQSSWLESETVNKLLKVIFVQDIGSAHRRSIFDTTSSKRSQEKQLYSTRVGQLPVVSNINYQNTDLLIIEKLLATVSETVPFHIGTMLREKQMYLCSVLNRKNAQLVTLNPSSQLLRLCKYFSVKGLV